MKALIQWSRDRPLGYEEYDSGSMPLHLKRPDPTGLDREPDEEPGYVHHLMVHGSVFTADHYCVRDREDGGVDVIYWNDSSAVGERFGAVRTFYPLSPDPDYGGAYNTKHGVDTRTHWAEDGARTLLLGMGLRASQVGRWEDFPKPEESETLHGLLVSNSLQQDHVFRVETEKRSWREWTEGVPETLVKNGRLIDQKTAGLFRKPTGTQTLIAKDSTTTDNTIHAASNELEIDRDTAAAGTVAEAVAATSDELTHLFTSISGVPNEATWPNGLYEWQIDVSSAGADITFGCLSIGGSSGHFARVNSGATAHIGATWTQTQGAFSLAGLHTASRTITPPTGSASDRFEMLLAAASAAIHGNQSLTLELNEADDFVRGPWADLPVFSTPNAARTKDVQRGLKIRKDHHLARGVRLFYGLLEGAGDKFNDSTDGQAHATLNASGTVNWQVTPQGIAKRLGDGANNHVTLANPGSLYSGFANGFTILVWMIKRGDPPAAIDGTMFHQDHSTASHTWGMEIKDGSLFLEMHARIAGATESITDDQELPDDEEHVFMGRYDPNLATNNAHLFIDAKEVQVATWSTGAFASSPDEKIDLGGHSGASDRRVPGDYLAAILWDRPLSDAEIALATADPMFLLRHISIPQMVDFAVGGGVTKQSETDDEGAGEFDAAPEVTARSATDVEGTFEGDVSPQITAESETNDEGTFEGDVVGQRLRASQTDLEGTGEADATPQITARPPVDDEGSLEEDASPAVTARAATNLEGTYEADVTPAGKVTAETDDEGSFEGDVAARVIARPSTDEEGGLEANVSPAITVESSTDLEGGFEGDVSGEVAAANVTSETDEEGAGEFDVSPQITAQSRTDDESGYEANLSPAITAESVTDLEGGYEASAEPAGKVAGATDMEGAGEGDAAPEVTARAATDLEGGLEDDASPRVTIRGATTNLETGFEASVVGVIRARAAVNLEGTAEMDATSRATVRTGTDLEGAGEMDANPGVKVRSSAAMEGTFEGNVEGAILEVLVDAALEGTYEADFSPGIKTQSRLSLEGAGEMRAELRRATWRYWLIRGGTEYEKTSTYFPAQLDTEALIHTRNRPADRDHRKASVLASRAFPPLRAFLRIRLPGEVNYTARDLTGADVRIKVIDIYGNVLVDQPAAIQEAATGLVRYDWQLHDLDTLGPFLVRWRVAWSPELPLFFPLLREVPLAVV